MRNLALVLCLVAAGSACSSAAAPGADTTIAQKEKATTLSVEAALRDAAVAEATYFTETQAYTDRMADLQQMGLNLPSGVELRIARADASGFCIDSSSAGAPLHVGTPDLAPLPGGCS